MASEKITAIIESVKGLTVLELKELIDAYCEEFGVSAVMMGCLSGQASWGQPAFSKRQYRRSLRFLPTF